MDCNTERTNKDSSIQNAAAVAGTTDLLLLNIVGVGIGVTVGGMVIDYMMAQGIPEPYTKTLLAFTILSLLAIPFFYLAGKRFDRDRKALFDSGLET